MVAYELVLDSFQPNHCRQDFVRSREDHLRYEFRAALWFC